MGFFRDFKEDLSEAVNGLNTESGEEEAMDSAEDDVIVNTLDETGLAHTTTDTRNEVYEQIAVTKEPEQTKAVNAEAFTNNGQNTLNKNGKEENMAENIGNNFSDEKDESLVESEADMMEVSAEDETADETAIITAGLNVTGNLDSIGSIDIFGTVTGDVTCRGKLTVSGTIEGASKANEIFVNSAEIDGNIEAKGSVKIGQGSVIVGNISGTSAVIAGAVKGDIDVPGPVIVDSTAIIVGDIKSKTVQINNGATIDGRCTQCYAEGNPTSIFDHKINK